MSRVFFTLVIAAILCWTYARFQGAAASVPSYVAWDMDQVITIDSYLIGSQRIPDNVSHPGFGMNLILTSSQAVAHALGSLSTRDLRGLDAALNPLLPAIEMTSFNRALSLPVALLVIALLWASLSYSLEWPSWLSCLGLLVLATGQGLIYQVMGVRSELYAIFFWALGMLAISFCARAPKKAHRPYWAIVAGVALGLSFFTKVQVIFYLVGAGLYLYYNLWHAGHAEETYSARLGTALSGLGMAILVAMLWGAYIVQPARGAGTFATNFTLTPPALGLLGLLAALGFAHQKPWGRRALVTLTSALMFGFVISPVFHFLIYGSPGTSWRYLLLDTKIAYLRADYYGSQSFQTSSSYLGRFLTVMKDDPVLMLAMIALVAAAVLLHRQDRPRMALLVSLSGAAILSIALGSRNNEHDWVWVELLTTLVALIAAGLIVDSEKRSYKIGVGLVLLALAATNIVASTSMPRRYRDSQANYGYRPWRYSRGVFAASYPLYTAPFNKRFQNAGWQAFRLSLQQMSDLPRYLGQAEAITGHEDPLSLGALSPGLPLWANQPGLLLTKVPPFFDGALVVDLPSEAKVDLKTRADLKGYLLLDAPHYKSLTGSAPEPEGERLELSDGQQKLTLYPLALAQSRSFSADDLGPRPTVVVKSLLDLPTADLPPDPSW